MTLEERVSRLETRNGFMRSAILVLTAALCATGLWPRHTHEAEEFRLARSGQDWSARLSMRPQWPGLTPGLYVRQPGGVMRLSCGVMNYGPALFLYDDLGHTRLSADVTMDEGLREVSGFYLFDENTSPRAALMLDAQGPHLDFFDEKGKVIWTAPPRGLTPPDLANPGGSKILNPGDPNGKEITPQ